MIRGSSWAYSSEHLQQGAQGCQDISQPSAPVSARHVFSRGECLLIPRDYMSSSLLVMHDVSAGGWCFSAEHDGNNGPDTCKSAPDGACAEGLRLLPASKGMGLCQTRQSRAVCYQAAS